VKRERPRRHWRYAKVGLLLAARSGEDRCAVILKFGGLAPNGGEVPR
jgi:hypothetical protein